MKQLLLFYFREVSNMRTQWDETNNLALDRLDRLKGNKDENVIQIRQTE